MKDKKYYILYKVKKSGSGEVLDIEYLKEYTKQADIIKDLQCSKRDIQAMLNTAFKNNIKTFKELTIIKEC